VPHAPVLGIGAALAQPQTVAREMVVEVEHQALGPIPIVSRPFKFDEAQSKPSAPPVLGQDTDAVLADLLGLDAARIGALKASKAIA
jgi:crotonobetainyl-CoA:carnitine CoA-transferase CaiB-like acyl-CoA transferase